MTLLKSDLQEHFTEPNELLGVKIRNTHPGQANFVEWPPVGLTCRECKHWQHTPFDYRKTDKLIMAARCAMFSKNNQGRKGAKVPDHALICRHFEANPNPPPRYTK